MISFLVSSKLILRIILHQELREDITPPLQIINLLRRKPTLLQQPSQPRLLLHRILRVPRDLRHSPKVITLHIIADVLGRLRELSSRLLHITHAVRRDVLRQDSVQGLDRAGLSIQSAADHAVHAGLLVDEVDEGVFCSGAGVGRGLGAALGEELDGGEAGDALFLC